MTFKIGDSVWVPATQCHQKQVHCSVCYGKKEVTLILGNDDRLTLPCDYCGKGYEAPTGVETIWTYEPDAELFTISSVHINENEDGIVIEYYANCRIFRGDECFVTKEEALAASAKLIEKKIKDDECRTECIKKDVKKTFAWNAGYHLRAAKDLKRQIEYHERMAKICKEREK